MLSRGDFNDHFYRSGDDRLDLYARVHDHGRGTAILMMHGLTRNSADFDTIASKLAPDHRLIIPDQRGRGRSQYDDDPGNYHPAIYVADMFALLQSLQIERAILLGTSMGGLIAMLMAAQRPEICAGLILNDIGPEVEPAGLARLLGYVGKSPPIADWAGAAAQCRRSNEIAFPEYDDQQWLEFARRTYVSDASGIPRPAYDLAIVKGIEGDEPSAAPANLWPIWQQSAAIPALIIRGETSDILARATVDRMLSNREAPITALEIPTRGHAPMLDEPDAVAAIERFLEPYRG